MYVKEKAGQLRILTRFEEYSCILVGGSQFFARLSQKLGTMTDTDMKNKGSKGENRQTGSERVIIFHAISLFRFSYLLELEELLLDLEPLGRRLVGLAPDELEHLVAAAADGPLGRLHHVGRGHDADDRGGDVAGPVCLSVESTHCTALFNTRTTGARSLEPIQEVGREGLS